MQLKFRGKTNKIRKVSAYLNIKHLIEIAAIRPANELCLQGHFILKTRGEERLPNDRPSSMIVEKMFKNTCFIKRAWLSIISIR